MSFISDPTTTSTPPATPPVDPYGVDLALGLDGDLVVNSSGSLTAVAGPYNCSQAIVTRLRTTPGEVALHPDYGAAVAALFVAAKMDVGAVALQMNADLQQMLLEDPRFVTAQVTDWTAPASAAYPDGVQLGVTATLVGGEQLSLDDVTDPAPSDVSLPQLVAPGIDPTLTYDPTSEQEYFADQPEFDELSDLNMLQSIVNDTPGASILGTGG